MAYTYREKMNFYIGADEAAEALMSTVDSLKVNICNCTSTSKKSKLEEDLQESIAWLTSCENQLRIQWFLKTIKDITGPFGICGEATDYFSADEFGDTFNLEFEESRLVIDDTYIVDYEKSKMELSEDGLLSFYTSDNCYLIKIKNWERFLDLKSE